MWCINEHLPDYGVLIGDEKDGVLDILIDYSTPAYRDCSVGAYLYSKLAAAKVHKLRFAQNLSDTHVSYMNKMGFVKEDGVYVKEVI